MAIATGVINVKVNLDPEALDLLQAIKDAVAAIEAQPSVTVVNNFEAPRG